MSARWVLVVGAGKRVREAALPALHRMEGRYEVRRVYARTAKTIGVEGRDYEVAALEGLGRADLAGVELIYLAVAKDAVPSALARLAEAGSGALASIDLLIDTPVVRFRHFRHVARLRAFRNAWVPEDCARLPWFDAVRAAVAAGAGPVERVVFDRSAYAYHGIASARALLGATRVRSARRRRAGGDGAVRELLFAGGGRATVREPRDYSVGHVEVHCANELLSDRAGPDSPDAPRRHLRPILAGGRVTGFELGSVRTALDADEADLTRGDPEPASVTARMEAMKRVGLLRLLRDVHAGRGAHPIDLALEDMVVDYALERLGRYVATPLTDPRAPLARALLGAASRLGG